ncbi:MAG: hypothetical protein JKY56_05540 [Kofleriaceae bacterium]|nr:hypothetical protein [Kofleriaceae bacterium]
MAWSGPALAQSLGQTESPKSVARAGTSTVSSDSGAALMHNPGAMIRRSQVRLILSGTILDSDLSYESDDTSPASINRASPVAAPLLAYHHGNERGTWVLGALFRRGRDEVSQATPAFGQPADDISQLFPHRYGGTHYQSQWRQFAVGGAVRVGDSLGIGLSLSLTQRRLQETRRIWAGFDGRDVLLSPGRDLELSLDASDDFAAGASVGMLFAPLDIPLEFALSGEYKQGANFEGGRARLTPTTASEFPLPSDNGGRASLDFADTLIVRTGLRYLGQRSSLEVGADLLLELGTSADTWSLQNIALTDDSGLNVALDSAHALSSQRDHFALRAAYDYEAVLGFLWLTAGYSYHSAEVSLHKFTPVFAKLGGHTGALGIEAYYDRFTLNFGVARRLARERTLSGAQAGQQVINPFDAGTATLGAGQYTSSATQVGVSLEVTWP